MSRRSRLFVSTQVKDWGQSPLSRVPDTDTFEPSQLSPAVWLDAADTTTITASGGAVSQWNNRGSLGNFTQATAANQPTTGSNTQNGRNVLDFAGDFMAAATASDYKFMHDGTKYLVAAAWKPGTVSNPSAIYALLHTSASTLSVGTIIYFDDSNVNNGIAQAIYRNVSGEFVVNGTSADVVTPNTWSVLTMLVDPSNATAAERTAFFINGGNANKPNTWTGAVSTANPSNALSVGSSGFPLTGSVGEIVVVSGSNATETNRAKVRNYLNTKWGVY